MSQSNVEIVYYHPYYLNTDTDYMYFLDMMDVTYDLELIVPPHKAHKSRLDICPAISVYNTHTYSIRSPINISLEYNHENGVWREWTPIGNTNLMIEPPAEGMPYVQLAIYYIFWTEKKSNVKLWQHDPPLHAFNYIPSWYTVPGMIPIGEYTRNTSIGFALKPGENIIDIQRGDIISALTFVGDSKIQLVKRTPSQEVIKQNTDNANKKRKCPYTASKELFSRWLKK